LIQLFEKVLKSPFLPQKISLRNDNGSQFVALKVQDYFKDKIRQEFTKPATPEQNAHIESYHSILESAICQRFEFEDLQALKITLDSFRQVYNFERIHGGIGFQSPVQYLQECHFNTDLLV
jgi:putative transposase